MLKSAQGQSDNAAAVSAIKVDAFRPQEGVKISVSFPFTTTITAVSR
jgi:hypothetical protein